MRIPFAGCALGILRTWLLIIFLCVSGLQRFNLVVLFAASSAVFEQSYNSEAHNIIIEGWILLLNCSNFELQTNALPHFFRLLSIMMSKISGLSPKISVCVWRGWSSIYVSHKKIYNLVCKDLISRKKLKKREKKKLKNLFPWTQK